MCVSKGKKWIQTKDKLSLFHSTVINHPYFLLPQILHSQVQGKRRVSTLGVQGQHPEKTDDWYPVCWQHVRVRSQNLSGRKWREVEHFRFSEDPWVRYIQSHYECLMDSTRKWCKMFFFRVIAILSKNSLLAHFSSFPDTTPHYIFC